jgi:hypothetical protein
MAVHKALHKQFNKKIPLEERILTTIYCESLFGVETHKCCVTDRRIALQERRGPASWTYSSIGFDKIQNVWIDERLFKATVVLMRTDGYQIRLDNVNKKEARDFVATITTRLEQENEILTKQTKV